MGQAKLGMGYPLALHDDIVMGGGKQHGCAHRFVFSLCVERARKGRRQLGRWAMPCLSMERPASIDFTARAFSSSRVRAALLSGHPVGGFSYRRSRRPLLNGWGCGGHGFGVGGIAAGKGWRRSEVHGRVAFFVFACSCARLCTFCVWQDHQKEVGR